MLNLQRVKLLCELKERGTIAAVADTLQYTPSAVSQQLSALEAELGVKLIERVGRGVRLTDAALVLVAQGATLLERAEAAEAALAAAEGTVTGRRRIAGFQSVARHLAIPAMERLARTQAELRCELVEAEPEAALPGLRLGDLDLVLADEWRGQPRALPAGLLRRDLMLDPARLVVPAGHPLLSARDGAIPLVELAEEIWVSSQEDLAWEELTHRVSRELGGFEADIRHHVSDASVGLELVSRGLAVTILPAFALLSPPPGVEVRAIAEGSVDRTIFTLERSADAIRPSSVALFEAIREEARRVAPRLGETAPEAAVESQAALTGQAKKI